jgi:hypothetical protein
MLLNVFERTQDTFVDTGTDPGDSYTLYVTFATTHSSTRAGLSSRK